jgi:hypothetical protein
VIAIAQSMTNQQTPEEMSRTLYGALSCVIAVV